MSKLIVFCLIVTSHLFAEKKDDSAFIVDVGVGVSAVAYTHIETRSKREVAVEDERDRTAYRNNLDIEDISTMDEFPNAMNIFIVLQKIVGLKLEYWSYTYQLNSEAILDFPGVQDYYIDNESFLLGLTLGGGKQQDGRDIYANVFAGVSKTFRTDRRLYVPGSVKSSDDQYLKDVFGFFVIGAISFRAFELLSFDFDVGFDYKDLTLTDMSRAIVKDEHMGAEMGVFARAGVSIFLRNYFGGE